MKIIIEYGFKFDCVKVSGNKIMDGHGLHEMLSV